MRRLLLVALGAAFLALGFAEGAAADDAGYRGKRVRAAGVRTAKIHRAVVVRRSYVPYVGYWRPPQPEPPSGPPGIATVYAYPYYAGPPVIYPSPYAGYAQHTPGYQFGIPRCNDCGTGFAFPYAPGWRGWGW
jgi:hypothetical protein